MSNGTPNQTTDNDCGTCGGSGRVVATEAAARNTPPGTSYVDLCGVCCGTGVRRNAPQMISRQDLDRLIGLVDRVADETRAMRIRHAVAHLNECIRTAAKAGLCVSFGIESFGAPERRVEVSDPRIERQGDRLNGIPDVKL